MTDQTNAELIAEANRLLAKNQWTSDWGVESLAERLVDALEAAEKRAEVEREEMARRWAGVIRANAALLDRLEKAEQERDNWKMSAEEAERAEKRWKDRAVEAERERDRLDEAFDRDLPWRYDEVEAQRNQLAAVVEKALRPKNIDYGHVDIAIERVREALATAPADALREVKADVWASGYNAGYSDRSTPGEPFTRNPYKAREERA